MLTESSNVITRDSVLCQRCGACLSIMSNLTKSADSSYVWTCDFCGHPNKDLILEDEEIPKTEITECIALCMNCAILLTYIQICSLHRRHSTDQQMSLLSFFAWMSVVLCVLL
jgi:hypothetical protein